MYFINPCNFYCSIIMAQKREEIRIYWYKVLYFIERNIQLDKHKSRCNCCDAEENN